MDFTRHGRGPGNVGTVEKNKTDSARTQRMIRFAEEGARSRSGGRCQGQLSALVLPDAHLRDSFAQRFGRRLQRFSTRQHNTPPRRTSGSSPCRKSLFRSSRRTGS